MTSFFSIILTLLWPPQSIACVPGDLSYVLVTATGSCASGHDFLCRYQQTLTEGELTVCCDGATCGVKPFGTECAGERFCDAL